MAAIGLKANISEADHPLLCEGTRRQRGDLSLLLLTTYKDQPERMAKIMDKILDKEIHPLFKSPILPCYYGNTRGAGVSGSGSNRQQQAMELAQQRAAMQQHAALPENHNAAARRGAGEERG